MGASFQEAEHRFGGGLCAFVRQKWGDDTEESGDFKVKSQEGRYLGIPSSGYRSGVGHYRCVKRVCSGGAKIWRCGGGYRFICEMWRNLKWESTDL